MVCVVVPVDSTDLFAEATAARQLHLAGEPVLPRKFAVAILLLRKLRRGKYWGGNHNKNYLWVDDLAKGRGVDEQFSDVVAEVANLMYLHGFLIAKYGGAGGHSKGQKYALNPDLRADIESACHEGNFAEIPLRRILLKDAAVVSARILD